MFIFSTTKSIIFNSWKIFKTKLENLQLFEYYSELSFHFESYPKNSKKAKTNTKKYLITFTNTILHKLFWWSERKGKLTGPYFPTFVLERQKNTKTKERIVFTKTPFCSCSLVRNAKTFEVVSIFLNFSTFVSQIFVLTRSFQTKFFWQVSMDKTASVKNWWVKFSSSEAWWGKDVEKMKIVRVFAAIQNIISSKLRLSFVHQNLSWHSRKSNDERASTVPQLFQ